MSRNAEWLSRRAAEVPRGVVSATPCVRRSSGERGSLGRRRTPLHRLCRRDRRVGDSVGDPLTCVNPVFDSANRVQRATDTCTRYKLGRYFGRL